MLWLSKLVAIMSVAFGLSVLGWMVADATGFSRPPVTLMEPAPPLEGSGEGNVAWLSITVGSVGASALVIGLVLLGKTYRTSAAWRGISIAPAGFALFTDVVLIAVGIFSVGVSLDAAWLTLTDQPSRLGLEPEWPSVQTFTGLHFVAVLSLLIAMPVLTAIFTGLSSQRIAIDSAGVTTIGAAQSTSLSWNHLTDVRVREQQNPAAAIVTDYRPLQRVLELTGKSGTLTINEPTSEARKQMIISALRQAAPVEKRALFDEITDW